MCQFFGMTGLQNICPDTNKAQNCHIRKHQIPDPPYHTPVIHDVIEDSLRVQDVIVARAEGAGVLIVAAVSTQRLTRRVTWVVRVKKWITC